MDSPPARTETPPHRGPHHTWDSPQDVNRAYELGANAFMVKPFDRNQYLQFTDAIAGYWLSVSAAPDLQHPYPELVTSDF